VRKKLLHSLKLRKACWIDVIPYKCLRYLSRRTLFHLPHLFKQCFRLSYFPPTWKKRAW
jgi:hypothetical protein